MLRDAEAGRADLVIAGARNGGRARARAAASRAGGPAGPLDLNGERLCLPDLVKAPGELAAAVSSGCWPASRRA